MKKVISLLLSGAVLLSPMCVSSISDLAVSADEVGIVGSGINDLGAKYTDSDGNIFWYADSGNYYKITSMSPEDSTTTLEVPGEIGGKQVVTIEGTGSLFLSNVDTVILPDSIYEIGSRSFSRCKNLKHINLSKVRRLYSYAFENCGLVEVDLSALSDIGDGAFSSCKDLTSVKFNKYVISIGDSAFEDCVSLDMAELSTDSYYDLKIGSYAFRNTGITNITVSDVVVKKMGTGVFANCKNLETVSLRNSIGEGMFSGCVNLKSVTFPTYGTYTIGVNAFNGCTSFEEFNRYYVQREINGRLVTYESKITSVGAGAFKDCISIKTVDLSSSCTSIGSGAFTGCSSLEEVYLLSEGEINLAVDAFNQDIYHPIRVVVVGNAHNIPIESICVDNQVAYRVVDEEEIAYPDWYSQSDSKPSTDTDGTDTEVDTDSDTDTDTDTDTDKKPISWGDLDPFNPFTPGKPKDTDSDKKDSDTDTDKVKDSDTDIMIKDSDTDTDSGKIKDSDTDTKLKDSDTDTDVGEVRDTDTDTKLKDSDTDVKVKDSDTDTKLKDSDTDSDSGEVKDSDTDTKVKDTDTDKKDTDSGKKVYYTVVFDFNVKGWDSVTQKVEKGTCAVTPKNNPREGYTFEGWYSNGKKYDFKNPITSDMTFKAKWVKVEPSKPSTRIMGDIDGDGKVTSADSLTVLRASVGLEKVSDDLKSIVDIDKDGRITSADSLSILRASVGLEKL